MNRNDSQTETTPVPSIDHSPRDKLSLSIISEDGGPSSVTQQYLVDSASSAYTKLQSQLQRHSASNTGRSASPSSVDLNSSGGGGASTASSRWFHRLSPVPTASSGHTTPPTNQRSQLRNGSTNTNQTHIPHEQLFASSSDEEEDDVDLRTVGKSSRTSAVGRAIGAALDHTRQRVPHRKRSRNKANNDKRSIPQQQDNETDAVALRGHGRKTNSEYSGGYYNEEGVGYAGQVEVKPYKEVAPRRWPLHYPYNTEGAVIANGNCCYRNRLYDLFGLVEKEFEALYTENSVLRMKVEELSERLGEVENENVAASEILADLQSGSEKPPSLVGSKKASHMGQKLKTAFRVPPGRLVSGFKAGVGVVGGGSSNTTRVRHVRPFSGHRDGVWDIAVAQAGPAGPGYGIIGSASADQTARFWCIESGNCIATYIGHSGSVNSIRFAPNNPGADMRCVTASGDKTAHVFTFTPPPSSNVTTSSKQQQQLSSTQQHQLQQQQSTLSETTHPWQATQEDDSELFTSSYYESGNHGDDGNVKENTVTIRSPSIELRGHKGVVIAADWLCSGDQVITASWDRAAHIYDVERGEILNMLCGHDQELTHTSAHCSQKLVVTSSKDFTFRLWDFRDPIHSVSVFQGHNESVTSAVFSSADKVISGSDDRSVKIWDLKNMRTALATMRFDAAINRLSVSQKFNTIAIPHDNRQVRIYDLCGTRIARLPRTNRRGHRRMVCGTAWADNNPTANLFTCGFDNMVLGWKYYQHNSVKDKE